MSRLPHDWVPPCAPGQAGVFTSRQARAAGASADQVRRRRRSGVWVVTAGDGLVLAGTPTTALTDAHAAMLTWPDAVLCLGTAARLHGLPVPEDGSVHVVLPHHRHARRRLTPHEYDLDAADVVHLGLLRATSRRRTLLDCIGRLPDDHSEQLVAWAFTRELLSRRDLADAVARRRRTWGTTRRRRALEDTRRGGVSTGERRLHGILDHHGIDGWVANAQIRDEAGVVARGDVAFLEERLVVEVDGLAFHTRDRFQRDRTRQNRLVAAGWTVLRFTWWDLVERPRYVAEQVRATLARLRAAV